MASVLDSNQTEAKPEDAFSVIIDMSNVMEMSENSKRNSVRVCPYLLEC